MRRSLPKTTHGIVARKATGEDVTPDAIHDAADRGTATATGELPHRAQLEGAFGMDLGGIRAHTGADAQDSARAMGAEAYAAGDHVVVPQDAGVGLVAHEVTHVLQQQSGVQLFGGVDGGAGDPLEMEADAVGAAVERGEIAASRYESYCSIVEEDLADA